jgi:DNA-binding beta-propeller fold protein YncE
VARRSAAPDQGEQDGTLSAIDAATNTVLDTFAVGASGDLALAPDGSRAYVNGGNHVAVVDLVTHEVTRIPGIVNGYLLTISPDGNHVYAGVVLAGQAAVAIIDL